MGIFGDSDASDAIKKAQEEYMQYLEKALGELRQSRLQGRTDIIGYAQPYLTAGKTGLAAYMASLGLGPTGGAGQQTSADRFRASPGYQFMMQQGINALSSANAARGMTGSGAAAMALQRYGQGLAQQEYGGYQQRLAGLAGMGQQTSMQTGQELGSLGLGYAGDISGLYSAMGQSQASAAIAAARARSAERSGLLGGLGTIAGTAIGAYYGGPMGAQMGGAIGGGLGRTAGGGQGWSAFGGQQQQQQQGGMMGMPNPMSMMGGMGGMMGMGGQQQQQQQPQQQQGGFGGLWGLFGRNYYPSYGTAASSMWGSNVWMNPDTGQMVPIY